MSSTIDTINTNVLMRINVLRNILNLYSGYALDSYDDSMVSHCLEQLSEIKLSYDFGSIDLLSEYYKMLSSNDTSKTNALYSRFIKFIETECIISKIKHIHTQCKRVQRIYDVNEPELSDWLNAYEKAIIDITTKMDANKLCSCGSVLVTDAKSCERVCKKCGESEKLYGVVFEDEQFFYQEGQRVKHGRYDPTKHCKVWADRIQAKENKEIPSTVINAIHRCMRRDSLWIDQLTCDNVRTYLKENDMTDYNNHAALIRKIITGKEPEQLTDHETKLLFIYFTMVVQIYNLIKQDEDSNCPFHPFFIYKILEQIINRPEDKLRKKRILSTIHLQSRATLISHDLKCMEIFKRIPGFSYIPTLSE